ncbi:MAG: hypothetical protein ACRYGM_18980 [Janthinobacterium lividum]
MSPSNDIHPTAIVTGAVTIGPGSVILPYSVLTGPLEIGRNNIIGPHTVIGSPGQDTRNPRYDSSRSRIRIGDDNIIREHVSIQKPCYGHTTDIGSRTYIMHNVHVPHDARIGDDAVLAPGVVLAGLVHVLRGANLAIGCTVHQRSVIGQYAIAAMGAIVIRNIRPFSRHIPDRPVSVNEYAVEKFGFGEWLPEIRDYVLSGAPPNAPEIVAIVDQYNQLHAASGREQY